MHHQSITSPLSLCGCIVDFHLWERFNEPLIEPSMLQEVVSTLHWDWRVSCSITSIYSLSTSNPCCDTLWPRTIPSFSMKWYFSQFKARLVSTHILSTRTKCVKNSSYLYSTIKMSSMNTSIKSSTIYANIEKCKVGMFLDHYIILRASFWIQSSYKGTLKCFSPYLLMR